MNENSRAKRLLTLSLNKAQVGKVLLLRTVHSEKKFDKIDLDPDQIPSSDELSISESSNDSLMYLNVQAPSTKNIDLNGSITDEESESADVATFILDLLLNNVMNNFTKRGAKRKRKKYETTLTERTRIRNENLVKKHGVKSPCNESCAKKCLSKISAQRRLAINKEFWQLTTKEQKTYYFNNAKRIPVKRRTTCSNSRRNATIKYCFRDQNGIDQEVCKKFFICTLGYNKKNDKRIRTVLKNSSKTSLQATPDLRGRHSPANKIDKSLIINHINPFQPSISHYRREHAANRKYLPTDLTVQMMWDDFKSQYKEFKCSYEVYRKAIREMNIVFVKLGHEECFACEKYFLHEKDFGHKRDELQPDCTQCIEYGIHKEKANAAREFYGIDKTASSGSSIYSADLQKVIMLPRYESLKEVIFTERIIAFNESFVPVGTKQKNKKPIATIWHEGVAGRSKTEIIITFYTFFLRHRDDKHIVLWLDNCSSQNKNWWILAFFIYIVNSDLFNIENLEITFFEPGHTFMSADSFHHQVEMSLKRKRKVYDFADFEECVQNSNSGRVIVINMKSSDFYYWGDYTSQYKLKKITPRPYLNTMVYLQFSKGDFDMAYKTSFFGEPIKVNFLNSKILRNGFPTPSPRNTDRGIPADRKNAILSKIGDVIPKTRLKFWEDLSVSQEQTPSSEEETEI